MGVFNLQLYASGGLQGMSAKLTYRSKYADGVLENVTAKKNHSYIVFQAPKKGTYTISISNIKTIPRQGNDTNLGNLWVKKFKKLSGSSSKGYLAAQTVSTNGGKSSCMYTATPYSYEKYHKTQKVTPYTYLANRYFKIRLKKGERIYLQYYYTGNKCTYQLKVQ